MVKRAVAEEAIEIDLGAPDGSVAGPADPEEVLLREDDAEDRLPAHAVSNEDGTVTLPLLFPRSVKWRTSGATREEVYDHLVFHRLTGADLRAVNAVTGEKMAVVAIARSTRISEMKMGPLYDRLDGADATAAMQVVTSFLGTGRKTTGR